MIVAQICPTLWDPMGCSPPGSSVRLDSPGKNTRVGCHSLLQGIFPTQGSNPSLPHYRQILYCLSHQGSHSLIQRLLANLCPLSSGENYYINYPERLASLPWGREGVVLIIPRVSLGRGYSWSLLSQNGNKSEQIDWWCLTWRNVKDLWRISSQWDWNIKCMQSTQHSVFYKVIAS